VYFSAIQHKEAVQIIEETKFVFIEHYISKLFICCCKYDAFDVDSIYFVSVKTVMSDLW